MKLIYQWYIQVLKLRNGFYYPVYYKGQFDAALVKFLICVEQLPGTKEDKTTDS